MRRHFLYPSQEHERGVGDGDTNLLQLWLARRNALLQHASVARFLVFFWDLAKAQQDDVLSVPRYNQFIALVAKALLQPVSADTATAIAPRDWLYDTEGVGVDAAAMDTDAGNATPTSMNIELFREALMQIAELILPVESDESMFASFFLELRECIAVPIDQTASNDDSDSNHQAGADTTATATRNPVLQSARSSLSLIDATTRFVLRPLKDVPKIRAAFLQKVSPDTDQLKTISALTLPDLQTMSLKQLLLSYNPRKFALSRQFSALFADARRATASSQSKAQQSTPQSSSTSLRSQLQESEADIGSNAALAAASTPRSSRILNLESEDEWNPELAALQALEQFPALRIAVVGPPHVGKTRVARVLADKLQLRYVSLSTALEDAVCRKQQRLAAARAAAAAVAAEAETVAEVGGNDEQQLQNGDSEQPAEDAETAVAASEAEIAPVAEYADVSSTEPCEQAQDDQLPPAAAVAASTDAPAVCEDDALFSDADLDALYAGTALSRLKCLALLIAFVKRSLLAGVGVVLDDVHPTEIEHEIHTDYVVVLSATQLDVQAQAQQFTLAPTSRRVYSMRERAMIEADGDTAVKATGFADVVQEPPPPAASSLLSKSTDAVDAQVRDGSPDADGGGGDTAENAAPVDSIDEGDEGERQQIDALPVEPTQAERNWIEPPNERMVPLRSLLMEHLDDRYREYASRVESRLAALSSCDKDSIAAVPRYHAVHALAAQSLCMILDQCVRAISGNALGVSRSSASRRIVPVELPEDVAMPESSRADQMRWLLHGDWRTLFDASEADDATAATGATDGNNTGDDAAEDEAIIETPIRDKWSLLPTRSRRRLSRWREFCPVSSRAAQTLVLGDPHYAVTVAGRVYLTATREARDALVAHPLQYLRAPPPQTRVRRVWLASNGSAATSSLLTAQLPALAARLDVCAIDARELLAKRCPMAAQMELMQGKRLVSAQAAAHFIDIAALASADATWLLANLPLTDETVAVLHGRGCLPDLVVVIEPSAEQLAATAAPPPHAPSTSDRTISEGNELAQLRDTYFQTSLSAVTEVLKTLNVRIVTSTLHHDVDDTVAALQRLVDPLAPRIDREDDGYLTAGDLAAAFAPSELHDDADEDEGGASKDGADDAFDGTALPVGETNRFCCVTWTRKRMLVPGRPEFVASFHGAFYCFASADALAAFERNPSKYVPQAAEATAAVVPNVLLLGVRGADLEQLSASAVRVASTRANVHVDSTYAVIAADSAAVARTLEQQQRIEALKSEDAQQSPLDLYAIALKCELERCETQCKAAADACGANSSSSNSCVLLTGLGADESLPSPEQLASCFAQDTFPLLVVPVTVDAERAVAVQLEQWRAQQPERRKKVSARRAPAADNDDSATESAEADAEANDAAAEAEANEIERLQEQFTADAEALAVALETLRARGIAIAATSIDASGSLRQRTSQLMRALDALMARKRSLFDRVQVVRDHTTLLRALTTGELLAGKHGTTCPVTHVANRSIERTTAVVYRERVYFPHHAEALAALTTNPSRFVAQQRSAPPGLAPTCCVAGAPSVGKTRFATALAAHYGLVYVSPRAAVEWVLQCHGATALHERLRAAHSAGAQPDAQAVADALATRLQSSECQARGWVLDDALQQPEDLERFKHDNKCNSVDPMLLILLDGNLRVIWQRKQAQLNIDRPTATRIELEAERTLLSSEFASWQRHRLDLLGYWNLTFGSVHVQQLDATQHSFWRALALTRTRIDKLVSSMRAYYQGTAVAGRVTKLHGVVRRSSVLRSQLHPVFQGYCPVELAVERYVCTWTTSDRRLCVQLGAYVFWLASARNVELFAAQPHAFVDTNATVHEHELAARPLIAAAPLDASLLSLLTVADCEFPELKGYCPVTFALGHGASDWAAIVRGLVVHRATYNNKVFVFASERMRRRFLCEPARFASQKLPVKLPPQLVTALGKNASAAGKLEQALAAVLNETLLLLGNARPKFMQTSVQASAYVYLALALKARATTLSPETASACVAKLRNFERDCRLSEALKTALTPSHASYGSAVKGVRAVRADLAQSASSSSLAIVTTAASGGTELGDDAQSLYQRFDEITGCSDASPRIDAATVRSSFLEYTSL